MPYWDISQIFPGHERVTKSTECKSMFLMSGCAEGGTEDTSNNKPWALTMQFPCSYCLCQAGWTWELCWALRVAVEEGFIRITRIYISKHGMHQNGGSWTTVQQGDPNSKNNQLWYRFHHNCSLQILVTGRNKWREWHYMTGEYIVKVKSSKGCRWTHRRNKLICGPEWTKFPGCGSIQAGMRVRYLCCGFHPLKMPSGWCACCFGSTMMAWLDGVMVFLTISNSQQCYGYYNWYTHVKLRSLLIIVKIAVKNEPLHVGVNNS